MTKAPANVPVNVFEDASEAATWNRIEGEWRPLFGSYFKEGLSVEYHNFRSRGPLRWHESFHSDSFEICLNWSGSGTITTDQNRLEIAPKTVAYYFPQDGRLDAVRREEEQHTFVTLELSREYLHRLFSGDESQLQPWLREYLGGKVRPRHFALAEPMPPSVQRLFPNWSKPPVLKAAQGLWYQSRVLEIISLLLFDPGASGEMFCTRQQRLARERVDKIKAMLEKDLANPPNMEQMGRVIGCSAPYLSRIFSSEMSMTMPQYLRQLRLEKAARLLREGRHNVTEAAYEVGYNSLSHFSKAFYETFGCCPGLYPQGAKLFAGQER
ncbi:MAG: AraC family transcriptional regulator [Verrucomicrobiota bacterium]